MTTVRYMPSTPPEPRRAPDPAPIPQSFDELTKAELIEVAAAQNLDTSGTKAEIIERLQS